MKLALERKLVTLYVDATRETARSLAESVAASFLSNGYEIASWKTQSAVAHMATSSACEEASLFITIGGDGTLLRAARVATECNCPLLGINTGRLGFLTELDYGDPRIEQLPQLIDQGDLCIDERIALLAEYAGASFFALNDVVVRKGDVSRIVPFGLSLDHEHIAEVPADGICVATPTGSTAYFLSAGGSIISPRVDAFGIVPLLPHTLFSRPLIVPASSKIEITCDSEVAHAHLECDGDVLAEIGPDTVVTVKRHPKRVRFARLSPLRFFERLGEKMSWGVSIKAPKR